MTGKIKITGLIIKWIFMPICGFIFNLMKNGHWLIISGISVAIKALIDFIKIESKPKR